MAATVAFCSSVENPAAFSSLRVSWVREPENRWSMAPWRLTCLSTPGRSRSVPENSLASSCGWMPWTWPRSHGWKRTSLWAWSSSGYSIVWQNCR
jgi:hypothetical protein